MVNSFFFKRYKNCILIINKSRALTPPGYIKDWHVGVRVSSTKKLVGLITGIPVNCRVYNKFVHFLRSLNYMTDL